MINQLTKKGKKKGRKPKYNYDAIGQDYETGNYTNKELATKWNIPVTYMDVVVRTLKKKGFKKPKSLKAQVIDKYYDLYDESLKTLTKVDVAKALGAIFEKPHPQITVILCNAKVWQEHPGAERSVVTTDHLITLFERYGNVQKVADITGISASSIYTRFNRKGFEYRNFNKKDNDEN